MTTRLNLIFDLDGTLIDSSVGVIQAVNHALAMAGCPPQPADKIIRYIGSPLKDMFADFTDTPYQALLTHFHDKADEAVVEEAVPLEGVGEALEVLRSQGYIMGIATTKARHQTDDILKRLKWTGYFKAVSGGDEVEQVKPAPDIFLLSMKRMKLKPASTIVIGDTVNDVLGARGAGLKIITVPSVCGDPEALTASEPDFKLDRFADLPDFLAELNRDWDFAGSSK